MVQEELEALVAAAGQFYQKHYHPLTRQTIRKNQSTIILMVFFPLEVQSGSQTNLVKLSW
jgi:hypothetical protein